MKTVWTNSTLVVALVLTTSARLAAYEPVDKELIPEARAVFDYLASVYGQKTIAAQNNVKNLRGLEQVAGKQPAMVGFDLSGWNSPAWGKSYRAVAQGSVDAARAWWAKGGIVTMQCHWIHPANPNGSAWLVKHGPKTASPPFDFASALQPGTKANEELMRDLKGHAEYLEQLAQARVPVLWRPFHEIDGGWFWWTDLEQPENTAALWRTMFNYFTRERHIHNLIWVYSAGPHCGKGKDSALKPELRRRFYPGSNYVDIAGIDVYPIAYYGFHQPQEDTYAGMFELMKQIAPGKMIALAECSALPNPHKLAKDGPPWLYCLPWYGIGAQQAADWAKATYGHEHFITLDQLPKW